jgi:uncharacterized protein YkwD
VRLPQAWLPGLAAIACALAALLLSLPSTASRAFAAGSCSVPRSAGTDGEEQSMLSLMNAHRSKNSLAPLTLSPTLGRAALWKSADMAVNHYFSHDDLSRGWLQRIQDCGYGSMSDGEDLAAGYADADETFDQWRTSPPHNANMLNPAFHAVGIGRAQAPGGQWYWTADFGPAVDSDGGSAAPSSPHSSSDASSTTGKIAVGSAAIVNTPGDCLRARASASLDSIVAACLPDGASVRIVAGPKTSDGYTWWQTGTGWIAGQYLKPTP